MAVEKKGPNGSAHKAPAPQSGVHTLPRGDARKPIMSREDCPNELIIKALKANGGIVKATAMVLGVTRRNLTQWLADDEQLREAQLECRADMVDLAKSVIFHHLQNKSFEAARYVLRCFGRHDGWIEVVRDEAAPTTNNNIIISAEAFDSRFASIIASAGRAKTPLIDDSRGETE